MTDLEALTSQFSDDIARLIEQCVRLVGEELPDARVVVYAGGWKNVQFKHARDILVAVNPMRDRVNVNIGHATELDDPHHVLEGTGKGIRHVKTWPGKPIPEQELRMLLRQVRERFAGP